MKESVKRIQFITDYISAYEEKIKLLNANGLFDSAKLFELFAIEVGSLYFGQKLSNLNVDTYTYPCVDLISTDKQTYIQVSTAKDIPAKIKKTLENIRDSKRPEINTLTNVKFIMLNNESVDKVKNYTGKAQIGDVSFAKENDLITTKDILQKAMNDLDFQLALYELLMKESESIKDNLYKLEEAIEDSKTVGLSNIDCKINNEYEIDRSELISKIRAESHKNISIQGGAGSGKSVLCKKIVEGEVNLVYARAERFLEETDINNIWGFNVRQTLEYLNDKPIVFFIDSLEFIADIPTKQDLLNILYECTKKYSTARIITSCRTSDKNAFIKIESNYSIHSYEVSELTIVEQLAISKKYTVIKKMLDMNSYAELLKSPFYINLVVSEIMDIDNISDENQLREHIWQQIVCLDDSEIKKIIESIVFTRAKGFLLGVISTDYNTKIIDTLVSKGVLVRNGKTVRLKYDIFEDICFEQHLDNEFSKCKGKYGEFFNEIEAFGRCIYRRYQIWISNKLFAKSNREKFLYELVFSDKIPQHWRKQTEIGLVKSRYCGEFFGEYGQTIIENRMINDFIKTANLYAFEIDNSDYAKMISYLQLRPGGEGRRSLIHLVAESKLHESEKVLIFDIEKLCSDYSKTHEKEKLTAEDACLLLTYIVDRYITDSDTKDYHKVDKINALLVPIYQMAEYSSKWITEFFERMTSFYQSGDRSKKRLAEDIIEDTLKYKHINLAKYLPLELCTLAEMFWTYSPKESQNGYGFDFYQRDRRDKSYQYGLSEKAEQYEQGSSRSTAINSNFFHALFNENFWKGLNWAIAFVNKSVLAFAEKQENGLPTYEINFIEENIKKNYFGFAEMWLVTTEEHRMPTVISDLIFCLKEVLYSVIENDAVVNKETAIFANNVKKLIFDKSNNIALLTIIADIGMAFRQKLPGYALDLATNIDIIRNDLIKLSLLIKNPSKELLEKQILMIMGMPSSLLPDRYNKKEAKPCDLLNYVRYYQINFDDDLTLKCHKILDYLYSIVPNDKENAIEYLQIQKMDLRTAQVVQVDDTTIALIPTVTGEAAKITTDNEKQRQPENAIASLISDCSEKVSKNDFYLEDCIEVIELLLETRNNSIMPEIDGILITFIIMALKDKTLDYDNRAKFIQIWIDGINSYFSGEGFIFEYSLSWVLFEQIEMDVFSGIKKQIKRLILDLVLFEDQHGVIREIARYAKLYLTTKEQLAISVFNTILKLAEDEMNHQKHNTEYIKKYRQREDFEFMPNEQPKLIDDNSYTEKDKREKYQSKKDEIIDKYLLNNAELDLSIFDINNCDITTLCYAMNCGLSLDDTTFARFVKNFIISVIDVWKANKETHRSHEILGVYPLYEVIDFFQKELLKSEKSASVLLDILFDDISFLKFTRETIEFYLDVFGALLAEYFDSHSDEARRTKCEKIIFSLESKIAAVKEEKVKIELYKSLIMSITRYDGSGDWSKLTSGYSYQDKRFLNDLFSKYGGFHLKEMLITIYKLHLDKLLPDILLSVRDAFKKASLKSKSELFTEIVREQKVITLVMITKAFLDFSDQIKQDDDLTNAFEEILEMLVEINYEEAATILDEFRVH